MIDKGNTSFSNGFILLIIFTIYGCGPLTKTQVSTIKKYQSIMGNYADYPFLLNEMTVDMRYQRTLLFPENWNDSLANLANVQAYRDYKNDIEMNDYMDMKSGLNKLKKYQDDFLNLFPNIYESHDFVEKSLSDLSIGIPLVGKSLTNMAVRGKKAVYNEPRIKREIKQQLIKGEKLANETNLWINLFIKQNLEQIKDEHTWLNKSYLQDVNSNKSNSKYMLQGYQDNYRTLNLYIFNLENISTELLKSANLWQETHEKILELIKERKKVDSFPELIDLQESINRIEFYILNANHYKH